MKTEDLVEILEDILEIYNDSEMTVNFTNENESSSIEIDGDTFMQILQEAGHILCVENEG